MAMVSRVSRAADEFRTVDLAGARWPVYKLESLVLAAAAGPVVLLGTGSPQAGVLAGAGVAALRWIYALRHTRGL